MKRLTIVPPDEKVSDRDREREQDRRAMREDPSRQLVEAIVDAENHDERRQHPRVERRQLQRRRSIARRILPDRRTSMFPEIDPLFAEIRSGNERRATAQRRSQGDRRAGVRKMDLTNLDLSELDH